MSPFFGVSSDYVRWLWPASVFLWFAIGLAICRLIVSNVSTVREHRARFVAAAAGIVVVSLANVPSHASLRGQRELDQQRAAARELIDAASGRVDVATVLYRPSPGYDVFGVPLLARLQSRGVEFVIDEPVLVRQFGERRRYDGGTITELHLLTAMDAVDAATNPNTIAFVSAASASERDELQAASIAIEPWLFDGSITLSARGVAAVDSGFGDPWLGQLGDPEIDAAPISRSIALARAVEAGLLDANGDITTTLRRFATLRQTVESATVAVTLVPPT